MVAPVTLGVLWGLQRIITTAATTAMVVVSSLGEDDTAR